MNGGIKEVGSLPTPREVTVTRDRSFRRILDPLLSGDNIYESHWREEPTWNLLIILKRGFDTFQTSVSRTEVRLVVTNPKTFDNLELGSVSLLRRSVPDEMPCVLESGDTGRTSEHILFVITRGQRLSDKVNSIVHIAHSTRGRRAGPNVCVT